MPPGDADLQPGDDLPPSRRRLRRRSVPWSTIYALGASLLVTATLIFALVIAALDDGVARRRGDADAADVVTLDPNVPVMPAQRIDGGPWQTLAEPIFPPPPAGSPVRLSQERIVLPPGPSPRVIYSAQAVCEGNGIVQRAMLTLNLLDGEARVYAQTTVPVLLVNSRQATPVVVHIPPALHAKMTTLLWEARVEAMMPAAVLIDAATIEPVASGRQTIARIKAFNPLSVPMKEMIFAVSARGPNGEILAQWLVKVDGPLGPNRSISFAAPTQVDEPVAQWVVRGAGIPTEPEAAAAPSP